MAEIAHISQSRLGFRTTFDFGAERLVHVISDNSGQREFSAEYDKLDIDNRTNLILPSNKPTSYLWAAGFPLGFLALRVGYGHQLWGGILGAAAFALIFLGILARDQQWFSVRMELVSVLGQSQPLRILSDGQNEVILAEIASRRRQQLRARQAIHVPGEDPRKAEQRFSWLLQIGVISAEEYAAAMTTISRMDAQASVH